MKKESKHTNTKINETQGKSAREEKRHKVTKRQKTIIRTKIVSPSLLVIILTVSVLNSPMKNMGWLKKF